MGCPVAYSQTVVGATAVWQMAGQESRAVINDISGRKQARPPLLLGRICFRGGGDGKRKTSR